MLPCWHTYLICHKDPLHACVMHLFEVLMNLFMASGQKFCSGAQVDLTFTPGSVKCKASEQENKTFNLGKICPFMQLHCVSDVRDISVKYRNEFLRCLHELVKCMVSETSADLFTSSMTSIP